ncbi:MULTISPECIES: heavy-metal-associated domain-containing protein [unclassified Leptolyngbya]|uniref:heavy-metal-associated domain-containing protein n=1 Tax=unclassified Leptolyngbya TaxID=2650499 RepID=UPI0016829660|nr:MULTISPECIES: heavy-metal-associated domain-containing protein [unclassified Leptolyngbya]MBD1910702.1 heavy-metal-associated domain-containing protein [Leptolyngbya sp. FACHB-8]MBD2154299.1 heavy-metal-associated domain-containing protein [Leptolyngbya sp. FACHB-16]
MTFQLTVPTMSCSACGETITEAIRAIDPTAVVQAEPKTKQVTVDTQATISAVKQAIVNAGYRVA